MTDHQITDEMIEAGAATSQLSALVADAGLRNDVVVEILEAVAPMIAAEAREEEAAENRQLAAWQCIHQDGVTGVTSDEHGRQLCAKDVVIAELEFAVTFAADKAREDALSDAMKIARDSYLVPPDGGSPTQEEYAVSERAYAAIRALRGTTSGTVTPPLDHNGMPAKFAVGDEVQKTSGYSWPGEVRAAYTTCGGQWRYVVECTVPEVAGAQHIFNGDQLALRGGK